MPINYLNNKTWWQITREERFFCAHLFFLIWNDLRKFLEWFKAQHYAEMKLDKQWEIGYEVCFYRDYLFAKGESVKKIKKPQKRTFDLALFSDDELIIFEAKVYEDFDTKQVEVFKADADKIAELLDKPIRIKIYALACKSYFDHSNAFKYWDKKDQNTPSKSKCFDDKITWKELADFYQDDILYRAEEVRKENLNSEKQ